MFDGMKDDAVSWMNYSAMASKAEIKRMIKLFTDESHAQRLLKFGLRPASILDDDPTIHPSPLDKPFQTKDEHLSDGNSLVDVYTGNYFRFDLGSGKLLFDPEASNNFLDAFEILHLASSRDSKGLPFQKLKRPAILFGTKVDKSPIVPPLEFHTGSDGTLTNILEKLTDSFCGNCGARKLWYRGQRTEYLLNRDSELTAQLYGQAREPSLIPSLGRLVTENPGVAGFGLSFTANHSWKKPFLVWLILENEQWFGSESNHVRLLRGILSDSNDERFAQLLLEIQLEPSIFGDSSVSGNILWPTEVDDLRQWFFAYMKRSEFAVTLQQYGYPTSLLDLTESSDVALYFSQAKVINGKFKTEAPSPGRVLYVFAERNSGAFFRHGKDLFWGNEDWSKIMPPRLALQKAGFIMGSTCRTRNFYSQMVVAKIWLDDPSDTTSLTDYDLFPYEKDLLYKTLFASKPVLHDLY